MSNIDGPRGPAVQGSLQARLNKMKAQQAEEDSALKELELAAQQAQEETQSVPTQDREPTVYDAIVASGGPPQQEIEAIKQQEDGEIHVVFLGEQPYIFRALLRGEWLKKQMLWEQRALTSEQQNEDLVKSCVLWPDFDEKWPGGLVASPAGFVNSMAGAIQWASLFLPENVVVNLVHRL